MQNKNQVSYEESFLAGETERGLCAKCSRISVVHKSLVFSSIVKVMKETTTIEKPHLVENFVQTLMNDCVENDDTLTFPKVDAFF